MSESEHDNTPAIALDNDSVVLGDYTPISLLSYCLQDSMSLSDNAMKLIDSTFQRALVLVLMYSSDKKAFIPLLVDPSSFPLAYSQGSALLTLKCLYLLVVLIFSFPPVHLFI